MDINIAEPIIRKLDLLIINGVDDYTDLDLNENTDIVDDLFYNSMNIMALIVAIEQEFGIEIPDDYLLFENLRKYSVLKEMIVHLVIDKEDKACENN